jgi:hypothetical protein
MKVLMVRSEVRPDAAADVEAAVKRLFAAIERERITGIRYASCRLSEGSTYVALLQVDDGVENPLPDLPDFREFEASLNGWITEAPVLEPMTVIGSYRLFDDDRATSAAGDKGRLEAG